MTEKRYKLIESDPCEDPYDCRMYVGILEDDVKELYGYKSICDRLNKLAKENEQLKKSIKRQQGSNNECAKLIEEQQKENEQLQKENRNLRFEMSMYEQKIEELEKELKE